MESQKDILIKEAFSNVKKDIDNLKERDSILRETLIVILEELKEIKERIKSQSNNPVLPQSHSNTQIKKQPPLKSIEKNLLERMDKTLVLKSIKHHVEEGRPTNYIKDEIISRFGIKERCFYNYLKLVRNSPFVKY